MSFKEIFPPIATALEMEPEELGPFVLRYLATQGEQINRYNFTLGSSPEVMAYAAGGHLEALCYRLMEAWMWLEREGFIMPRPGQQLDWATITRRGHQVLAAQDFTTYRKESVLRSSELDSILVRKVKPGYLRGDYDTAIFQAFKEVEVRVRKKGGFPDGKIGVDLMREAFKPKTGPLANQAAEGGEQQAMMDLFAGAIGTFKNPSSHRDVDHRPEAVADIIGIANQLPQRCHTAQASAASGRLCVRLARGALAHPRTYGTAQAGIARARDRCRDSQALGLLAGSTVYRKSATTRAMLARFQAPAQPVRRSPAWIRPGCPTSRILTRTRPSNRLLSALAQGLSSPPVHAQLPVDP